jgi:saccharopine dehydrogenase (NADP+, L-glutamate forming)
MKRLLVLGAGFVAGPLVRYFLERSDVDVVVADLDLERARGQAGSHPRGTAVALDFRDAEATRREISRADVVASLLPHVFHPDVARFCLAEKKNMVTTSYAGEAMRAFDEDARRAGIVILNEVGLDPGIDHMEAKRIIDEVHGRGGQVRGFRSYCGGLPAPEARTNPFGYKFSWSPRGVLLAGRDSSRYLKDAAEVFVPAEDLFADPEAVAVEGLGDFEGYPNRDAVPYLGLYGIPEARTIFRGTLRWPGWCATFKAIGRLGLLDLAVRDLAGLTYRQLTAELAGLSGKSDLRGALREKFPRDVSADVLGRLGWLGLLSDALLPANATSPLDVLEHLMVEKLQYRPGERDMIVLRHELWASYPDGRAEKIVSTLVDFGIPGGSSAMARTVGFSAAAAVRLILEGRVSARGVVIPVLAELYGPILDELRRRGIVFKKERESLAFA